MTEGTRFAGIGLIGMAGAIAASCLCVLSGLSGAEAEFAVEVEEEVARCEPPGNGAGPLWCYGSPLLLRRGDEVFASVMETGAGVPLLANTRPRLFLKRGDGPWELIYAPEGFREREPCPIALDAGGAVYLSVNPSTQPPGTQYGPCDPHLLRVEPGRDGGAPEPLRPPWPEGARFTDHSYRGLAAGGKGEGLLVLNIDAASSEQHWVFRGAGGNWTRGGRIRFPIRSCYPQVALRGRAAHVLAIGDIVEPVEEWRRFKREESGREWDYVFRRLFYTFNRDLGAAEFSGPLEVENLDATAGHIRNLDLWIGPDGAAHLLYTRQQVQSASMRDRFFPGLPLERELVHAVVREGKVIERTVLAGGAGAAAEPGDARFHSTGGSDLLVVHAASVSRDGKRILENRIAPVLPRRGAPRTIPLKIPFGALFTASERGGSEPSPVIDLLGIAGDGRILRYARLRRRAPEDGPAEPATPGR